MTISHWRAATLALLLPFGPAAAQEATHDHMHDYGGAKPACAEPTLACASTATPAFAADGTLWLTWAAAGRVSVARSADKGAHFSDPVFVTPEPVKLDTGPDSRPAIAVAPDGGIVVAFAVFKDQNWNGEVRVSRSADGGQHFASPAPIAAGSPSQRFQGMEIDSNGRVFAVWLDKRNVAPARARGENYPGAALAFAWSDGDRFQPSRIAADNTCECCRLGLGFVAPGRPVVAFRNVFPGGERDHALIVFDGPDSPGSPHRVSEDHWKIEGCPHQGPSLAVSVAGTIHVAWFTGGGVRTGLFMARSAGGGATFSAPTPLGSPAKQNSRATLLAIGRTIYVAWKSFDGERTEIQTIVSRDDGISWSAPNTIATTDDDSDHPLLVADGHTAYLSWQTKHEGYRLIPLDRTS
jgi:hypothetical protein